MKIHGSPVYQRWTVLFVLLLFSASAELRASDKSHRGSAKGQRGSAKTKIGPLVRSVSYPKDSRGEEVYDIQDGTQKNLPTVPGVFKPPSVKKIVKAKPPKHIWVHGLPDITVEWVIAQNGECIDAHIVDPADLDTVVSERVLHAISRWRFKAATLDGKPIAVLARTVVHD